MTSSAWSARTSPTTASRPERLLSEFVAEFAGLSGTAKRKAVTDAAGLSRAPLSRLAERRRVRSRGWSSGCSGAMSRRGQVDQARRGSGSSVASTSQSDLEAMGGDPGSFAVSASQRASTAEGRPWLLEVAFAHRPGARRRIIAGVNWSTGIGEPFRALGYWLGDRYCGARATRC